MNLSIFLKVSEFFICIFFPEYSSLRRHVDDRQTSNGGEDGTDMDIFRMVVVVVVVVLGLLCGFRVC